MRRLGERSVVVALILAALGTAACASSPGAQQLPEGRSAIGTMTIDAATSRFDIRYMEEVSPVEDTVNAIVEEVWNLVPEAYVQVGVPIGGVNPEARLLGNTSFQARGELAGTRLSDLVDCGRTMTGDIANQYDLQFSVLTQVREEGGKSVVATLVDATAQPRGVSGNAVACSSTGKLEREIVTRIRSQLLGIE